MKIYQFEYQTTPIRIVSQLGFKKLWPVVSQWYPDLAAKYQVLHDCIIKSLQLSSVAAGYCYMQFSSHNCYLLNSLSI